MMNVTDKLISVRAGNAGLFASVQKYMQRRKIFNQTFNELSQLSERELWDLGLARGDIARVARSAAEQA